MIPYHVADPQVFEIDRVVLTHEGQCRLAVEVAPLPRIGRETGIAVGLKVFLVTAGGDVVDNPRHHRRAEQALKQAQRRVSRRKKGSMRRKKAVRLLAKQHQQVWRQRRDFQHKTALAVLREYDVIALEDLRVRHLVRNHRLATSISDAGWAALRTTREEKAACAGQRVVAVAPASTTPDGQWLWHTDPAASLSPSVPLSAPPVGW